MLTPRDKEGTSSKETMEGRTTEHRNRDAQHTAYARTQTLLQFKVYCQAARLSSKCSYRTPFITHAIKMLSLMLRSIWPILYRLQALMQSLISSPIIISVIKRHLYSAEEVDVSEFLHLIDVSGLGHLLIVEENPGRLVFFRKDLTDEGNVVTTTY